jgi:sulfite exporter TauE/SafE
MFYLAFTVFLASIAGSLHCVGMCGAFVAMSVGGAGEAGPVWHRSVAYHGGRFLTYSLLGAAAGALGAAVNLGGYLIGIEPLALLVAGATVVLFGIASLLKTTGIRLPTYHGPAFLTRTLTAINRRAFSLSPTTRALVIGLSTTLLPCGWLYTFAFVAAGTGSAGWGAVTMGAFFLGTVPALASIGLASQLLLRRFGKLVPIAASLLMILAGSATILTRSQLSVAAMLQNLDHKREHQPTTLPAIDDVPPCCASKAEVKP